MNDPDPTTGFRRILVATDLSARSDRAFDRAVQLARLWQAELHVVHAIEAPPQALAENYREILWRQRGPQRGMEVAELIRRDLGDALPDAHIHLEEEPASTAILAVVARERCDLLVLGEPDPTSAPALGESTLAEVVRKSPAAVLVVKSRPRGPYARVLVGSDFTDESRQALEVATRRFGGAAFTLMHALQLPYASLLEGTEQVRHSTAERFEALRTELAQADVDPEVRERIQITVQDGRPDSTLQQYVLGTGTDLTVIGAHARGFLFDAVVGSTRRIVDAVPGDVLVVRAQVREPTGAG